MTTPSNITTVQGAAATGQPKGKAGSGHPGGLLGFFDAILQQISATLQARGQISATQNADPATQGIKGLAEKIAALLRKNGVTAADLAKMSPQDLAAKITQLLQGQNIAIPAALQNIPAQDLSPQIAAALQANAAATHTASAAAAIKPALTSDLAALQAPQLQSADHAQTKNDIAQKISNFLEKQQKTANAAPVTPAELAHLKGEIAKLQAAPGTVDPAALSRLTGDISQFLTSHGIDQATVSGFVADLTQTLEKTKTATDATAASVAPPAAAAQTPQQQASATPAALAADKSQQNAAIPSSATEQKQASQQNATLPASNNPPPGQKQANAAQPADNAPANGANAKTAAENSTPAPYKGIGKAVTDNINGGAATEKAAAQSASAAPSIPLSQTPASQSLTAKISGLHGATAAVLSAMSATDGGASTGGDANTGGGTQSGAQNITTLAALLQQTGSAAGRGFTNYLSAATHGGTPSPTTQMVAVQMMQNVNAGINAMSFQLEPADLGRLDVKLKFAKDGSVKAHMTVDKPETLALLQKDASHLQNALKQSGLHADENAISFDLRQQNQQQNFNGNNNGNGGRNNRIASNSNNGMAGALSAHIAVQAAGYISQSGVNIMV